MLLMINYICLARGSRYHAIARKYPNCRHEEGGELEAFDPADLMGLSVEELFGYSFAACCQVKVVVIIIIWFFEANI